jgi:hypothetical protein
MDLTTDPTDPRLTHGVDETPVPQAETYLVLSPEELAKGFVRPYRESYFHVHGKYPCGTVTTMGRPIAETYARNPHFYGATYCVACAKHLPLGEFEWFDGTKLGS